MKANLPVILTTSILTLVTARTVQAQQTLYYNFQSLAAGAQTAGTTVDNVGNATDGTIQLPQGAINIIPNVTITTPLGGNTLNLGNVAEFVPNTDNEADGFNSHILANDSVLNFGITGDSVYTAMAWMNFNSIVNDNMVFGQTAGDALHLGSRAGAYLSGHWGDDVGPDQGFASSTGVGVWNHVAFTNDGATGIQTIYVNGDQLHTGAGGAFGGFNANLGQALTIGISRNNGSFSGSLDEVRVFDERLSEAQIEQYANGTIPEPTSAALLAFSALGMTALLRRRRR